MKKITLNIYEFHELNDKAKEKAYHSIVSDLYDFELAEYQSIHRDFDLHMQEYGFINYDDLKTICDRIGMWLTLDFIEVYKYHGLRDTAFVKKAFGDYLNQQWEEHFIGYDDIAEHCEYNEILFYEDGTVYR